MICPFCQDQFNGAIQLHCGQHVCQACLLQHLKTTLQQASASTNLEKVNCPFYSAQHSHRPRLQSLLQLLPTKSKQAGDYLLAKRYVQNAQDMLPCPTSNCRQYFFTTESYFSCDMKCHSCNAVVVKKTSFVDYFLVDKLSQLNKLVWATACPSCSVPVHKIVGCNHIVCTCTTQFCYGCGRHWHGHNREECDFCLAVKAFIIITGLLSLLLCTLSVPTWRFILALGLTVSTVVLALVVNVGVIVLLCMRFKVSYLLIFLLFWNNQYLSQASSIYYYSNYIQLLMVLGLQVFNYLAHNRGYY